MIDYGIPNDSLKLRRHIFKELMTPDEATGYMDGEDYHLMLPFKDDYQPDLETRLWMAFLYGMSYSCTTVIRFVTEFPTVGDINPHRVKQFWSSYRDELWFQPDKKYLKNNNQVVPAIKSIYQQSHGNMTEYLVPLLEQGFDVTYQEILKHWRYFGPSGAYLFFDAIYGLSPELYSDPTALDWNNCGKTVPEGMAHLLGLDDQATGAAPYDIPLYNKNVDKWAARLPAPKIVIESNLCFLRKLFKATRYLGYYADRQLCECSATAELLEKHCGVDIWDYRARTCPDYLRGEVGGWDGIRKERYKIFLTTGTLMGDEQ